MSDSRSLGERYRLLPTQFNDLIHELVSAEQAKNQNVIEETIKIDSSHSAAMTLTYYIIKKDYPAEDGTIIIKRFVLSPVLKDSRSESNENGLVYVGDFVEQFCKKHPHENYILLLPERLCRGFMCMPIYLPKMQRRHIVLTVFDTAAFRFDVHDSHGNLTRAFYPDALSSIQTINDKPVKYVHHDHYHAHGIQDDNILCGFYVHQFILSILKYGDERHVGKIKCEYAEQPQHKEQNEFCIYIGARDKYDYLRRYIPRLADKLSDEWEMVQDQSDPEDRDDEFDDFTLIDSRKSVVSVEPAASVLGYFASQSLLGVAVDNDYKAPSLRDQN